GARGRGTAVRLRGGGGGRPGGRDRPARAGRPARGRGGPWAGARGRGAAAGRPGGGRPGGGRGGAGTGGGPGAGPCRPGRAASRDPGWASWLVRLATGYPSAHERAPAVPMGDAEPEPVHTARVRLAAAVESVLIGPDRI